MAINWLHEGYKRFQAEQYAEALQCFDQGLAVDPDDGALLTFKGAALGRLGRYEEGAKYCGRAITLNPQDAYAHAMLGAILADKGELTPGERGAAIACLEYAQRLGQPGVGQILEALRRG